jgi:glycosyltransferase involved in cell wall biosynthesis
MRKPACESPVTAGRADIAICNWRDLRHPEGGGSELYVERVARGLAAAGNRVTLLSAAVAGQPSDETRDGVRYRRRGSRHTVYLHAAWAIASRRVRPDVVLDVQNGVPFLTPLATRRPVVALVHHVHREQWPVLFSPRAARVGWWVESRLGPFLYRRSRYLVVSDATRRDLAQLLTDPARITVAHNGTPEPATTGGARSATPRVVLLGRLVPHKRADIAMRAVKALSPRYPDLVVDVVGHGYAEDALREEVERLGLTDRVVFHGFVDEPTKCNLLAAAWVNAVPSLKEGWALAVVEAGMQATPSLAFAGAGGLDESVIGGVSGVLVDGGEAEFTAALDALLGDAERRRSLGEGARRHAMMFDWDDTVRTVAAVLDASLEHTDPLTAPAAELVRSAV